MDTTTKFVLGFFLAAVGAAGSKLYKLWSTTVATGTRVRHNATTTKVVWVFFLAAVAAKGAVSTPVLNVAHNTSTTLACRCKLPSYPALYMNHSLLSAPVYNVFNLGAGDLQGLLTIDGNETCGTLQLNCTAGAETIYAIRLTIEGTLPPPENVAISSQNSSAIQLQWKPPYYTLNQEYDVIQVDPHITHYTVYIFDASNTDNSIDSVHVTEPGFTPTNNIPPCPMYQVSAWNAGGEGELSEPVQESTPQVPIVENINVTVTAESGALRFHIEVGVVCPSRKPEFFHVTLMSGSETTRHYQRDFIISPPPNVDVCAILPRISAGNTAGTSPIERVVVVCSGDSTDSMTTTSTTTVTSASSSRSGSEDNNQQGNSTTLIVILIGIIATIGGVLIVAATIVIIYCRGHKKDKLKKREIEMIPNQAYETVTLPSSSRCETQVHTKPCPAYEVVVQAYH